MSIVLRNIDDVYTYEEVLRAYNNAPRDSGAFKVIEAIYLFMVTHKMERIHRIVMLSAIEREAIEFGLSLSKGGQ